MINYGNSYAEAFIIQRIGSLSANEGVQYSNEPVSLNEDNAKDFADFFLHPYSKLFEEYRFSDTSYMKEHIQDFFEGNIAEMELSCQLADIVYEQSEEEGSCFFALLLLKGLVIENRITEGILIARLDQREEILFPTVENQSVKADLFPGFRSSKVQKSALFINLADEAGFRILVQDNSVGESKWKKDTLGVKPLVDKHFQTKHVLDMYREFVMEEAPKSFEMHKIDQSELMQRSINYMKNNQTFKMDDFQQQVLTQPKVIDAFNGYVEQKTIENEYRIPGEFEISPQAVKKQSKYIRSVIKLDKNFHVYVHGNREMIERGFDPESGRHYYKLFFKTEE